MEWHRAEKIHMVDEKTGHINAILYPSYRVQVSGKDVGAHYITEHEQAVLGNVVEHVRSVISDLSHDDEPVTLTLSGGGLSPVTITIQRWYITREDLKRLPPFEERGDKKSGDNERG